MIDELDLIRTSMDDVPPPSDEVLARLRANLDLIVAASAASQRMPTRHCIRWGSRRVRIAASAVVVAAAAVVAITVLPSSTGGPAPAAAAALRNLAHIAANEPATVPPAAGQFQYTDSEDAYEQCAGAPLVAPSTTTTLPVAGNSGDSPSVTPSASTTARNDYCMLVPEHRQIWIGADYSGRILESFGTPVFLSPVDEATWRAAGSPLNGAHDSDTTFGPHTLSLGPPNFASLPTGPTALGKLISARKVESGPPGPAEDFNQVGDLLRETDASPALRAALYEFAATIPGVELLGSVPDHAGAMGIGIGYTSDGVRDELFFDPTTSALLGEESVAVVNDPSGYDVPAGTVIDWADYLASGIVNSLSLTPSGTVTAAPPVSCTAINPATAPPGSLGGAYTGDGESWPTTCKPGTGP